MMDRRSFLKYTSLASVGLGFTDRFVSNETSLKKPFFEISLAEWSLHRTIQAGKLINMDFPAKAKNDFGINAVEYVDQFFKDKAKDQAYLSELKQRAADLGVRNVLIMVDTAGPLADPDTAKRKAAVENHYQWIDAARFLGCHSIRVNLRGNANAEDLALASIDGLGALSEYGAKNKIGVIVENHGGPSSDAKWLAHVITKVANPYCGTLPDFDNFCLEKANNACVKEYDRYLGVEEMMPFAKGLSAKSRDFDASGNETTIDFKRLLTIAKKGKTKEFKGYAGIEYSGTRMSEDDGIRATKLLLDKLGPEIA
jgi:hypothetical protein